MALYDILFPLTPIFWCVCEPILRVSTFTKMVSQVVFNENQVRNLLALEWMPVNQKYIQIMIQMNAECVCVYVCS